MQDVQLSVGASVRLISLSEVIRLTARGRSRIYADIQIGVFPAPIKDGASSRWIESEILSWIAKRIAERNSPLVAA